MFKCEGGYFEPWKLDFDAAREGQKKKRNNKAKVRVVGRRPASLSVSGLGCERRRRDGAGGRRRVAAYRGRAGVGEGSGERKKQRGSKLSNKQAKAKGKAQESRHQY